MIVPQCGDASEMIDANEKKRRDLNWRIFLTILEILQFLARQGYTLRGDDDEESRFIQLPKLGSKLFPELTDWLSRRSEKFKRHDVQNEIVNLMAKLFVIS